MTVEFKEMMPLVIYDNECYLCVQFAKLVNFLTKGRLLLVGHYTDLGKRIRDGILDSSALEMFWFIDEKTAYGGRAAIGPLLAAVLHVNKKNVRKEIVEDSCDLGCKSPKAVFFRSASLLTHSKRINLRNL
jgi:predicted DCC family thiol-disulfide oxidoreductase YuxK